MSYRGRPSRGCKRCVAKKVKCDQTHPKCERCINADAECEYRDLFELVHRNQTRTAERTAKDKWRKRATKTQSESPAAASPGAVASAAASERQSPASNAGPSDQGLALQPSLRPSLQQLSFMRLIYDFVSPQDSGHSIGPSAFDPLPQLFVQSRTGSPLYSAISAVSLANFGGRFKSSDATLQGAVHYGHALTAFATSMSGPRASLSSDEAMIGIFLLGIYEMLTSAKFDGTYRMHQHGAGALLEERWNDSTMHDRLNSKYLALIYIQIVMNALSEGSNPPRYDPRWVLLFGAQNPHTRLTILMHQAAILRHTLIRQSKISFTTPLAGSGSCVDEAINAALEDDSRLEEWYEDSVIGLHWMQREPVPLHIKRRPQWARDLMSLPGAPCAMHAYCDVLAALAANLCRASRLWLNISILRRAARMALELAPGSKERIYLESLCDSTAGLLSELVEGICLSTPCLLQMKVDPGDGDPATPDEINGFRGLLFFWPLIGAMIALTQESVEALDGNLRKGWIPSVLAFLRNNLSLAKAEAFQPFSLLSQPAPYPGSPFTKTQEPPPGLLDMDR